MMEPKGRKTPARSGGFRYGVEKHFNGFCEKYLGSHSRISWKRFIMRCVWMVAVATPLAAGYLTWYAMSGLWTDSATVSAKVDLKEPWEADPSRTKESRKNGLYSYTDEMTNRGDVLVIVPQRSLPAPMLKATKKPHKPPMKGNMAIRKKPGKIVPDIATSQKKTPEEKRFVVKPASGPPERRQPALPKLLRKLFQLFAPVTRQVY